jgi:hypothetical protein
MLDVRWPVAVFGGEKPRTGLEQKMLSSVWLAKFIVRGVPEVNQILPKL